MENVGGGRWTHCDANHKDPMSDGELRYSDERAFIWQAEHGIALELDPTIYPVEAALAAAYRFSDRAYVWLQSSAVQGRYIAFLRPKNGGTDPIALSGAFANELADQAVRRRLDDRFAALRTLVFAEAFSEADLLQVVSKPPSDS